MSVLSFSNYDIYNVLFYFKTQYCMPYGINTNCVSMVGNAIISIRPSVSVCVCSPVSF